MGKINLCNLIANDIVHYGMDTTTSFNYTENFDEYITEFDDDSQQYIYKNKDTILNCINSNENIADLQVNDSDIDMVFYLDGLLDRLEKQIYNAGEVINVDLEIDDLHSISDGVLKSQELNEIITQEIKNYKRLNYDYQGDV